MNVEKTNQLIDRALDRLADALDQGQSEQLRTYLGAMGRFHRYSLYNMLLIAMARPNATHVAGFNAWKRLGRHVRRGERGIAIFAPMVRRKDSKTTANAEPKDADGVFGFKRAHVFDISQTKGRELPEFARVQGDPTGFLKRVKAMIQSHGIELCYSDAIAPALGQSAKGMITIVPGLSLAEEFSTLVHEYAHELLHSGSDERSKVVRETEAEATAFAVCEFIGLQTSSASCDYIQLYRGDRKTLVTSLQRIRTVVSQIIDGIGGSSLPSAVCH